MSDTVEQAAQDASDHPALEGLARGGYAVNGVLHLVIAWIIVQILTGSGGEEASHSGALTAVREAPGGTVLLWIGALGYAGLALWQMLEAAVGYHPRGRSGGLAQRAKELGKGIVYGLLAWTTWRFATGNGTDSEQSTADFTATLMQAPLGQALVFAVGLAVLAVGGYHIWKGARRRFLEDLAGTAAGDLGRAVILTGVIGYVGKGVALLAVGLLFCVAAWTTDPEEATGLDGALQALSGSPAGAVVLAVIAVGFVGFGLYSFARARYADL